MTIKRSNIWRNVLSAMCATLALVVAGCGGGGGGSTPVVVTSITPASARGGPKPFTVSGTGFSQDSGTIATVRFVAPAGTTPFAGGTSGTHDVTDATVDSDAAISGSIPNVNLAAPINATVEVILANGAMGSGGAGVVIELGPIEVTAFAPGTVIGAGGTAIIVTGTAFSPVGDTAKVTFTAPGTPFADGTSNTLVINNATITSDTQIDATCPDPLVLGSTTATVTVELTDGAIGTGGASVNALFDVFGVVGKLQYEFVPHVAYDPNGAGIQTSGLDFTAIQARDLAGVRVQLIRTTDQAVLASAGSALDGTYVLRSTTTDPVVVRVLARSHSGPDLQVQDNANADAVWAMQSPASLNVGNTKVTENLTATTGWNGGSQTYTGVRAAAPFSVFSTIWGATQKILTTVTPAPTFAALPVKWSPTNNQGAAFWNGTFIMLRGSDGVNTDEFDTHVLVHEWGHYFESTFSRSDSTGGQHFFGGDYTPSLSWGEGWATGLAAMMLEPDSIYSDTNGPANAGGFMVDLERRVANANGAFGWFNEWTIWELVYDLADTNNEGAHDTLSLGVQGLFNSVAAGQKNTTAFTTVFSFINTLKTDNPGSAAQIDAMCALHGMTAVQDDVGTGEAVNNGVATNVPVYTALTLDAAATPFTLRRNVGTNRLEGNKLFTFVGNGNQVTVVRTSPAGDAGNQPAFVPYRDGVSQTGGFFVSAGNSFSTSFSTVNGATYTVRAWHYNGGGGFGTAGTYTPTVRVTSP